MAITSDRNLYPGINIHLNSYLQNRANGWRTFHSLHVPHISEHLDTVLPPGYVTITEESIQFTTVNPGVDPTQRDTVTPDVPVLQQRPASASQSATLNPTAPLDTIPLVETLVEEDEDTLSGMVIYHMSDDHPAGKPVTRLELLSPSNKFSGSYHQQYRYKREETLRGGLRLVEIDYLHQTPPVVPRLPMYAKREDNAYAHMILVNDPRPSVDEGTTAIYVFGVDDPMPVIEIPLLNDDTVMLDFGAVYNRTFASSRYFRPLVDYAQDPVALERYHPDDQALIRARLAQVRAEHDEK